MNEIVQVRMNNWAALIKARQESGQTVQDWCTENDISVNAYYYWLRKLRKAAISITDAQDQDKTEFVQVPHSLVGNAGNCTLSIRCGDILIEVSNDASDSILSFAKEVILSC